MVKKKRIIKSIIACMLILITLGVMPVYAEGGNTLTLTPSKSTVELGETFTVDIVFNTDDSNKIRSGILPITYDPNILEFVGIKEHDEISLFVYGAETYVIKNGFCFTVPIDAKNITLLTVEFKTLLSGTTTVSIKNNAYILCADNIEYAFSDGDDTRKPISCIDAKIKVTEPGASEEDPWYMVADLNGDGKINLAKDLNYFWEAYWYMQDEEFGFNIGDMDITDLCNRADFNGDGKINLAKDLNYFWTCYWAYQDSIG